MKQPVDWEEKLDIFNFAEAMLDKGYAKAWFTWLEWVTLTAAFLVLGHQAKSPVVLVLGGASAGLVLLIGMVGSQRLAIQLAGSLRITKWLLLSGLVVFLIAAQWAVIEVFKVIVTIAKPAS